MHKNHPHKHVHKHHPTKHPVPPFPWLVFLFTALFIIYWIGGTMLRPSRNPDLYKAYQILWLPMIVCTACLPVYLFVQLNKQKFKLSTIFWIPVAMMVFAGLALIYLNQ